MLKVIFENGMYLWYLLSIPILIISHFYFLKKAKYKALKFSNFDTIRRLTGHGKGKFLTKNWVILFFRLLILISLILAISSPIFWYKAKSHNNDYIIAIDASASMLARDFEPNRLGAAKLNAIEFVSNIQGDSKIGIIDFAGSTFVEQILTQDRTKIIETLEDIDSISLGGTDLAGAIVSSVNMLMFSEKGRMVILISDGSNTVDAYNQRAIKTAVNYAIDNQVIVTTMGIGTNTGPIGYLPEYYNITAVYNPQQLKYIANATEGRFYDGNSSVSFTAAFEDILTNSEETYVSKNLQSILLLIGLLALFIEWGLINTRYKRLP